MSRFDSALLKIEAAGRGRYQGCRGAGARFGTLGRAAWIHSVDPGQSCDNFPIIVAIIAIIASNRNQRTP